MEATVFQIPKEFYEDLDQRIKKAVDEGISGIVPAPVYYSRKETCNLLKISLPTLEKYLKSGVIKGHKFGLSILISREDIETALQGS